MNFIQELLGLYTSVAASDGDPSFLAASADYSQIEPTKYQQQYLLLAS